MNRSVVVMCMGGVGHIQVLMPVIEGLHRRGCRVRVMTKAEFRDKVEAGGAEFFDLFARYPLEATDASSIPFPSRFVTFAAVYAQALAKEVAASKPDLVVYDTFSVAAPVVARLLGVPYINVCPNHAAVPTRTVAELNRDPRVATSPECRAAVERLQVEHGLHNASPFFYVQALSPFLNLYCEPEEFLSPEDRSVFEPVAYFGSLPMHATDSATVPRPPGRPVSVYVSFGTVVFRYFEQAAVAALTTIARTLASDQVNLLISLSGNQLEPALREALAHGNIRVANYVDQWRILQETDIFITHHGINSTHESIFHGTPMISYPFFGDQPALARRCQDLGLAVPLAESPRGAVAPAALRSAIARLTDERDTFAARLAEARTWELRTLTNRKAVFDRILALQG